MNSAEVLIKFKGDTNNLDKATASATNSLGKLTKAFTLGNIAAKGISKGIEVFTANLGDAVSRVDTLKNFPKVMSNLGISAEDSEKAINLLSDKLKGLPTSIDDAALSVQRFTSKNGDVSKSADLFLAVNNAILAGGASPQIQANALEQLSQAYAKGKPDMMEWRSIQTAMPAQLKQVAQAMGYADAATLGATIRAEGGEKEFSRMMDTMMKMNTEGVGGFKSFEEQAKNSTGGIKTSLTNMKTAFVRGIAGIIEQVNSSLEPFGGLSGIITTIGKIGEEIFKNLGSVLSEVIPMLIDIGKEIFPVLKSTFESIMPTLKNLVKALLPALSKLIKKIVPIVANIIQKIMPVIVKLLDAITPLLDPIADFISALIEWNMALIEPLLDIATAILPPIIDALSFLVSAILPMLTAGIKGLIAIINGIKKAFGAIINFFKNNWQGILLFILNPFAGAFKLIYDNCEGFRNVVNNVINAVKGFFTGLWNSMKSGAVNAWNGIKSVFSTVANFFKNIFTNAWNGVKAVFSTGGKIFTGIKDGIVSAFKNIVNKIIDGINRVIKIPFDGINAVLKKIKNISILGKKPFKGLISTIAVPKIPHLEVGTNYVPDDTLAMIHKGEAVIPKKFNPYASMNNSMLGTMNNSRNKQVINVYASFKQDNLGQMVRDIKTFSGGARNDYNYGSGI